jgi:hypothetical protein
LPNYYGSQISHAFKYSTLSNGRIISTMATNFKDKDKEDPVEVHTVSTKHEIAEAVREATELEHKLTFFQAVKLYPKAIGWSMYFSLGVIMLGKTNCSSHASGA